jgi:DNA-binding response OmpR family regulator
MMDQGRSGASGPEEDRVPMRVLIVDDDRDTADSLAIFLRHAGHRVGVAYDGDGALEAARIDPPHVVVLDIGLPGLDGYEVARRLRREPGLAGVTLVALSGYGSELHQARSRDAGFDHHLVKPIDAERVHEIVAAHARERWGLRRAESATDGSRRAGKR